MAAMFFSSVLHAPFLERPMAAMRFIAVIHKNIAAIDLSDRWMVVLLTDVAFRKWNTSSSPMVNLQVC